MPGMINLDLIKRLRSKKGFTYGDMASALGLKEPEKYYRREQGKYMFQGNVLQP